MTRTQKYKTSLRGISGFSYNKINAKIKTQTITPWGRGKIITLKNLAANGRTKSSSNRKMSNESKDIINEINELLAQDTIPVYYIDVDSDEVEILAETVEIISTTNAEYEIIEYKSKI